MKKLILVISFLLIIPSLFAQGWNPPTEDPPSSNIGAPIQEGIETQTKSGGLNVLDSLGVGTEDPEGTF